MKKEKEKKMAEHYKSTESKKLNRPGWWSKVKFND